jgi:hypothetical protein
VGDVYTVTVRTTCRACAMALAGHVSGLIAARSVFVQPHDENAAPGSLIIHANSQMLKAHDGSPCVCTEHGGKSDLSREPEMGGGR